MWLVFSFLDEIYRDNMRFGDNSRMSVMGKGNVTLHSKEIVHTISNMFFIPELRINLLSIGQFTRKGI